MKNYKLSHVANVDLSVLSNQKSQNNYGQGRSRVPKNLINSRDSGSYDDKDGINLLDRHSRE